MLLTTLESNSPTVRVRSATYRSWRNGTVSQYWDGTRYCGLQPDWGTCDVSIPGYIERALQRFQHPHPGNNPNTPHTRGRNSNAGPSNSTPRSRHFSIPRCSRYQTTSANHWGPSLLRTSCRAHIDSCTAICVDIRPKAPSTKYSV